MDSLAELFKNYEEQSHGKLLKKLLECEELRDVIRDVIKMEKALMPNSPRIKEYMHMDYFLKEYRISRKTFHEWKSDTYVHSKQQGRFKLYNVLQFDQAARKSRSKRPNFKRAA